MALQRFVHRDAGVEAMHVVEIDVVGLGDDEGCFLALGDDGPSADAFRPFGSSGSMREVDLGRHDQSVAVAFLLDDLTDDRLQLRPDPAAVYIGGVAEEVDPRLERRRPGSPPRFVFGYAVAEHTQHPRQSGLTSTPVRPSERIPPLAHLLSIVPTCPTSVLDEGATYA